MTIGIGRLCSAKWALGIGVWLGMGLGTCAGQEAREWIGRKVVLPFGAGLRVNGVVIDNQKLEDRVNGGRRFVHRVYRVEQVDGQWGWVQAEKSPAHGWIELAEIIPYERALDYYTYQIKIDQSNAAAYLIRGLILREQEKLDQAMADFDAAVRIDPKSEMAWSNRGLGWATRKDFDKAIEDYTKALELDPRFAIAYYDRGLAWYHKKDYDKAIADYSQAIRLDSQYVRAFCNRGLAFYKKKNYSRALADYNEAVRIDPKCAWAYDGRGNTWCDKNEIDVAIKNYTLAIESDPNNATFYDDRANALRRKAAYAKANSDYGRAIRIDPKDAAAFRGRAWILATCPEAKFRDGKKAVELAKKACELTEWKDGQCVDTLAAAYAEAGNFENAVKWETKARGMVGEEIGEGEFEARLALYRMNTVYRDEKN